MAAAATTLRGKVPSLGSVHLRGDSRNAFGGWVSGALALPAAGLNFKLYLLYLIFCSVFFSSCHT